MSDRENAMRTVQTYRFMMIDIGLFLDSHPGDREALAEFEKYRDLYLDASEKYSCKYGPLTLTMTDGNTPPFAWVETPWPWEVC